MRKYIYIIIGVVIIIIIAVVLMFVWKGSSSTTVTPGGNTGTLPGVGTQSTNPAPSGGNTGVSGENQGGAGTTATGQAIGKNFGVVSNETVLNYFVDASNTALTVQPDGKIEKITQGQSVYLSSSEISNIISADFSYDGKRILVGFGNSTNPQWSVFDVDKKAWAPLLVSPTVAAWSPSNYQIAYFAGVNGASALETLDTSDPKAKPKLLAALSNQDFEISWPSSSTIFLSDKSSAIFSGSILSFNPKTSVFSSVVQNKVGLEVNWNAGGTMGVILVGTQLGRGGSLGIIDNVGNLLHQMTFLTFPSKCVFTPASLAAGQAPPSAVATATATTSKASAATSSAQGAVVSKSSTSVVCGVPRDASALSKNQLPDAYDEMRIMTSDDIYQVSLIDGSINPIFNDPSQTLDVSNIKFFNGVLFFVNRYNQKLYAISLAR